MTVLWHKGPEHDEEQGREDMACASALPPCAAQAAARRCYRQA